MRAPKWAVGLALGVVAAGVIVEACHEKELTQLQTEEKVLDTVYVYVKQQQQQVQTHTDSALAGPGTIPKDSARVLVTNEREACRAVVTACDAKVTNLKAQVAALQPPRLRLFAEAEYDNGLDLRLGAGVKLDRSTQVQVYVTEDLRLGFGLRKEFRLF